MAVRYSDTLSQQTLYAAQRLADGTVLRVSSAQYSVWVLVLQALQPVALMMLLAFILAMALASRVARQLVEPINAIDLNDPAGSETYEELTPLLSKLRSQQRQIQRQMRDLKRRQEEFTAITENMSEGFLVIDQETRVLTYNSAVLRLLYAQVPTEEGESVYALNREAGFRRCVEEALAGRRCEQLLEKDDDCRQIIASPVEQDGQIAGAVLVILDVTEKEQRERLRREFTANVSHELKTPLTSILGTAEILQNGLVKPEDVPHFAGNIHRETERLIGLVNDIIKLSRLDEGGGLGQWETVDLYEEARAVLEQLAPAAQRKQVTTRLQGGEALVRGVPRSWRRSSTTSATTPSPTTGRTAASPSQWKIPPSALGSRWRILASAFPGRPRAGYSSGFTGWTRAIPPAARDWGSPSSSTGRPIWVPRWSSTANRATAAPLRLPFRRREHEGGLQSRRKCARITGD